MGHDLLLVIDQGTTGTKVLVVDDQARVVTSASAEVQQYYPNPGWVEHDPEGIWQGVQRLLQAVTSQVNPQHIRGVGITNQRETAVAWDRSTGEAIHRAIVWQCRRTVKACQDMRNQGFEEVVRSKTGLTIDPYFSGSKFQWLLTNDERVDALAQRDQLCFGTMDSWLLWKLTAGRCFATDVSNAARTLLFNIDTLDWDSELLSIFKVPRSALPKVEPTGHVFGRTAALGTLPADIPIAAMMGDSQAALFGHCCFGAGMAKATYGTGTSVMMFHGSQRPTPPTGMLATVAWAMGQDVAYAVEGTINVTGATMQWLRDGLGLLDDAAASDHIAASLPDNGGVYLVPAFAGLGAPHWDMEAKGLLTGLTRGTTKEHIIRAALESTALQVTDVVQHAQAHGMPALQQLWADGGASANGFLMQFQADLLAAQVMTSSVKEVSAMGTAYMAGLTLGIWPDLEALSKLRIPARVYAPSMDVETRKLLLAQWSEAVQRCLTK